MRCRLPAHGVLGLVELQHGMGSDLQADRRRHPDSPTGRSLLHLLKVGKQARTKVPLVSKLVNLKLMAIGAHAAAEASIGTQRLRESVDSEQLPPSGLVAWKKFDHSSGRRGRSAYS
jgi:hypothetical protein